MKIISLLVFFAVVLAVPVLAAEPLHYFPAKERAVFKVKWLGITAGEVVAEIKGLTELRGRKVYRMP
jgi:hypothetical protein